MKTPSRLMPAYVSEPVSLAMTIMRSLFLLGVITLAGFGVWHRPWIIWIFGALVVYGMVAGWLTKNSLRKRAAARTHENICTFARSFDRKEVDTWIIRAVYEELQPYLDFGKGVCPLRATDRLFDDLYMDPDDLHFDLQYAIAQRTNRSLDESETNPYCGKVETVEDLVLFFNCQPKTELNKV